MCSSDLRDALVMINANYSSWHHSLPAGTYKVHINDGVVHSDPKAQEINKKLVVPPLRLAVVEHINWRKENSKSRCSGHRA